MTGPEVIVNDVYVSPTDSNRVMLATDRGGVLVSNDGGHNFSQTNNGFSSRQITSYVEDIQHPGTIYVGLVNDKAWGGVFVSTNGGLTWTQKNVGLEAHDVFSLGQAPNGTIFAGTRHGIYRLNGDTWSKVDRVSLALPVTAPPPAPAKPTTRKGAAAKTTVKAAPATKKPVVKPFNGTVFAFTRDGDRMFAATQDGVLKSTDSGQNWTLAANPDGHVWYSIGASNSTTFAASLS